MFDILIKNPRKTIVVLLIPALVVTVYLGLVLRYTQAQNDGYVGALLDDTWIHVRFAESLAQGRGLMYNDGVVTPGATSPLWVLILAGIYRLGDFSLDGQVHVAVLLSAASTVFTVVTVTAFGWWGTRRAWVGFAAGLMVAVTGRFIWMGFSGMEVTLFAGLSVLAVWSHLADLRAGRVFGWRTGIITALATLARPEGYLLAVVLGLDAFVLVPLLNGLLHNWRMMLPKLISGWRGILAYVLLAGSYPLACLMLTGYPLPNTFRVKSQLGEQAPDLPYAFFWTPRVDYSWLVVLLAGLGIVYLVWQSLRKRENFGFAWALWPVVFVMAVLFQTTDAYVVNNGRYVSPAIPFHALAAAVGVFALQDMVRQRFSGWASAMPRFVLSAGLVVLAAGLVFWQGRSQGAAVANDVGQLYKMHVTAGHWLAENTVPDAIIALNDVGAMVHVSDREVLDLMGLVSPEVIDAINGETRFTCPYDLQLARLMLDKRPELIGIFPWWYACMVNWPGMLQAYTQFEITGPTVIAGGNLVMYWPVWENWPVQSSIAASALPLNVTFGQGITLAAYERAITAENATVKLWWQAAEQPTDDWTVFLHLLDADGAIIAQDDARPQAGRFNTLWWRPGDIIPDQRTINAPAGVDLTAAVALRIGLYQTDGTARLPRLDGSDGQSDFVVVPLP